MSELPSSLNDKIWAERWIEHCAGHANNLRSHLINAVAEHEGWEESAVALVDEAIIPVIYWQETETMGDASTRKDEELSKEARQTFGAASPELPSTLIDLSAAIAEINEGFVVEAEGRFISVERVIEILNRNVKSSEIRLNEDVRFLACAVLGITPDRNTQSKEKADASEQRIIETARHYLQPRDYTLPKRESEKHNLRDAVITLNKALDTYWNGNRTDYQEILITDAQWKCKEELNRK